MERLSSGFRINRAADDAAGLAVSEKLKAQIGGLNQASRNAQDGISMIQTAEGALDEVQSMMQRMRDLAVQAASDTNSQTERDNINLELNQLHQEINSISVRTKFNGQSLLSGSLVTQQLGASGTNGYGGSTELIAGIGVTSGVSVTAVTVDGAQAGRGYLISGDTTASTLTLTMTDTSGAAIVASTDTNGTTHGITETIDVKDVAAGASESLTFSNLGVKITLASADTNGTAVNLIAGLTGSAYTVDTQTGSGTAVLQTGANQGDETRVSFVNTSLAGGTGVKEMDDLAAALDLYGSTGNATRDNASSLISVLDNALGSISSSRATLGAAQNRLQHTIANLGTTSENLSASNSRIRDVDVATESSNMAKNQVLEQAGVSVLAQANQLPQLALKLLG
jgi:flagellin